MSLFAGSVYSSPGVLQGDLGNRLPPEPYQDVQVSTILVANVMEVLGQNSISGKAMLTSSVTLSNGAIKMPAGQGQINGLGNITSFGGSIRGISMPSTILTNMSSIQTGALSNISGVGSPGLTFATPTAFTDIPNLNISSINGVPPVTYSFKGASCNDAPPGFGVFSTVQTVISNLDPTSLYTVFYTGQVSSMTVPAATSNDSLFWTCEDQIGVQKASESLLKATQLSAGIASTCVFYDSFVVVPKNTTSSISLGFGATTASNAANRFHISYTNFLLAKQGGIVT
jgi:hypothetical protein